MLDGIPWYTYIFYGKNQPQMQVDMPYMDPIGNDGWYRPFESVWLFRIDYFFGCSSGSGKKQTHRPIVWGIFFGGGNCLDLSCTQWIQV